MRFASLAAVCLAAAGAVSAVPAAAPAPSGTPCTYSCPAADEAGFELGRSSKPNANTLPGETGLYYCNYNSAVRPAPPLSGFDWRAVQTGALKSDKDEGFCPPTASSTCSATRRDTAGVYAAYQRQIAKRAAAPAPAPAPRPQFMNTRASLGQRKLLNRRE
jgi:hypothetical protein